MYTELEANRRRGAPSTDTSNSLGLLWEAHPRGDSSAVSQRLNKAHQRAIFNRLASDADR